MEAEAKETYTTCFGHISKNMNSTHNPLSHLSSSEWICNISYLMNEKEFNKHFECNNRICIASGGQGKIYLYKPKNILNKDNKNLQTIVKIYKLKYGNSEIQRIWREFVLIKESNLLYYGSMFYNRNLGEILITSEPLNYTLKQMIISKKKINLYTTEYECKLIIIEIIDKLYTLHKCDYIHCDIKPSNIMKRNIKKSQNKNNKKNKNILNGWKIIDYGAILSIKQTQKIYNKNGKKLQFKYRGTIGWTSPELNINSIINKFTIKCDIWSIGLLILYIIFGKQPYQITQNELNKLKIKTKQEKKEYFYKYKLLRQSYIINKQNGKIIQYIDDEKQSNNIEDSKGQIFIQNYLIKLYYKNKISFQLFDLLHNCILKFDPKQRYNCKKLYKHKWFDQVRDL